MDKTWSYRPFPPARNGLQVDIGNLNNPIITKKQMGGWTCPCYVDTINVLKIVRTQLG